MRRILLICCLTLLLSAGIFIIVLNKINYKPVECATFRIETVSHTNSYRYFGCDIEHDFGDGTHLKVVNFKNYFLFFNKYMFVNLATVKNNMVQKHWYPVKVFKGMERISVDIKSDRDISSHPEDKRLIMNIGDFKAWLDNNEFKNKQVVAFLFKETGGNVQSLVKILVYLSFSELAQQGKSIGGDRYYIDDNWEIRLLSTPMFREMNTLIGDLRFDRTQNNNALWVNIVN